MKKFVKVFILIIVLLIGLIALRIIFKKPSAEESSARAGAKQQVVVKVDKVKKGELGLVLSYVGSLKAKDEAYVFSKVTGKLYELKVNEGDKVEKGQPIAMVDRDETGLTFELARVESPITGIVGRIYMDRGASISPKIDIFQGTPLAMVVNMEEMLVQLNAPEADIPYLKLGLEAKIKCDAYPDEVFIGKVSRVAEIVDLQTRTLPIEITIPNSEHRLKSGMFCRIQILAAQLKDRLVVVQDALVQEQGQNYVFIVEEGTARKRMVKLGVRQDNLAEIAEGLQEGQELIVFGQQGLKDGTAVKTED